MNDCLREERGAQMIYTWDTAVRWNDTDADLHVRPSQLLVYMQEAACRHMHDAGQDLDDLRFARGLAFIVTRLTLRFHSHLHPLENIRVQTWIDEARGVNFPRYFRVLGESGATVAEGASDWALMDLSTHMPVRADAFSYNTEPSPALSLRPPRRFAPAEPMCEVGRRRIAYSDIDYNGHMNNTRYPDMVCDFLPDGTVAWVRQMSFEFVREAACGTTLRVLRGERLTPAGERAYLLRTEDGEGRTCLQAEVTLAPGETDAPAEADAPGEVRHE